MFWEGVDSAPPPPTTHTHQGVHGDKMSGVLCWRTFQDLFYVSLSSLGMFQKGINGDGDGNVY